jgi:hypothetical protein
MAQERGREAHLRLNNNEHPTMLRVTLPPKITKPELAKLTDHIVENIIRPHTGCTCLSGTINVLIESVYQEAVRVEV